MKHKNGNKLGHIEKVSGNDEDSMTGQKTALLKQKHPGLYTQSTSGNDGQVSRTYTGLNPQLHQICLSLPIPVSETIKAADRNSSTNRESRGRGQGSFRLHM